MSGAGARLLWADGAAAWRVALGYRDPRQAVADRRGSVVRALPRGETLRHELGEGLPPLFRKLRRRGRSAARNEWHRLHELPALGIPAPRPVFVAWAGRRSALGMLPAPGREVSALLAEESRHAVRRRFLIEIAVPLVRRLHGAGLFHRDLYWGHWFAVDLGTAPALIDLERMIRPLPLRRRRWRLKDVAALVASWPWPDDVDAPLWDEALAALHLTAAECRAVRRRVQRIRRHVPRHDGRPDAGGGPPCTRRERRVRPP